MQLLVVGRSLKTAKDRPSPYRLAQQSLLPRFGPQKTARREEGGSVPHEPEGVERREPAGASPSPECGMTMNSTKCDAGPEAAAVPAVEEARSPGRWKFWSWNPFRPAVPPPPQRKADGAIQGELLLEGVKVVRNDLCDSDLELVPVESSCVAARTESAVGAAASTGVRPLVWPRITARVFGDGQGKE